MREEGLLNLLLRGQIEGNVEKNIKYNILDELTKMKIGIWLRKK